jgi:hypothetical protein
MDTIALVENQIDAGQQLLDRLGEDGMVVRAACWLKPFDRDRWSLYIATPRVDEKGTLGAYRQLGPVMRPLEDGWLTGSDVTLVGEKHPLVKYARDILRRFPHKKPIRSPLPLFGELSVEEVYVYPLGKEKVPIYSLIFRGEPSGCRHYSLEPPNPQSKLVVEGNEYPAEIGIDWVAAPEGARLERNERGLLVLTWDLHGQRWQSRASEIWSFAEHGLHGFRFLHVPTESHSDQGN